MGVCTLDEVRLACRKTSTNKKKGPEESGLIADHWKQTPQSLDLGGRPVGAHRPCRAAAGYRVIPSPSQRCVPASNHLNSYLHQGGVMIERNVTLPEMILWTGTRIALGAGIGMLISRRLSKDAMTAAGLALAVVGGLTTIPLAISIMGKKDLTRPEIRSVA